jgi:hypothetical protein
MAGANYWSGPAALGALFTALAGSGCSSAEGCRGGDDGACLPASACQGLAVACDGDSVRSYRVGGSYAATGPRSGAARGDWVLENGQVRAVFDALDAPHGLAPSGGSLIDLEPADGSAPDALNEIYQAVGILPDDAVLQRSVEVRSEEGPSSVSLVYRGTLDGRPDFDVVTRYELRACEQGLRVRTEIHRDGRDPLTVFPADALFWGDRGLLPFVPGRGLGFRQPELDLEFLSEALVDVPFLTAAAPGTSCAAYAIVPCGSALSTSFHSATLSAIGAPTTILMPGDGIAFERFIGVARGPGHGAAISLARALRSALHGEAAIPLSGRLVDELGRGVSGAEERAALLIYEAASAADPDDVAERTVVAEAAPDDDGNFDVLVPSGASYRVEVLLFGRPLAQHFEVSADAAEAVLGELVVPASASLSVAVRDHEGAPLVSELVLLPVDSEAAELYAGSIFGEFAEPHCTPYLGPPHGASPACNRALVDPSGTVSFALPPGDYWVYATHGPFWSLARQRATLEPGASLELEFELAPLQLLPDGALSADLHVHGAASFDSTLPDRDRALSFVASDVAVIAATDHDVVSDYGAALEALDLADSVHVMPGVETTGQILFYAAPDEDIPRVIGHFNFWPLRFDPSQPRRGAPDDELVEPAALFERVAPLFDGPGVRQLNHPFAESKLGRDEGYFTAVGWDPRQRLPGAPDGSPAGELVRRASGGGRNIDYDVQEVMNGASVALFLAYRAAWFSLLNQGELRAGTANSDSHTLAVELLGYPRTVVFDQGSFADFDRARFNAAVREGRSFGTNGPVLDVCVGGASAECRGPSLEAFTPALGARLRLAVAAAPWVPVEELRIYVNGALARVIPVDVRVEDAFAELPLSFLTDLALEELAAESGDYWLVVEAGASLPAFGVGEEGLPVLTQPSGDERLPESHAAFHLQAVAPKTLPLAFTNPFFVDVNGDGWTAPGSP